MTARADRDSCLHLVVSADERALDDCLRHLAARDTVVLLDRGVLHLLRSSSTACFDTPARVLFAEADLAAHGLADTALRGGVDTVDDAGVCALLAVCRHSLTWT